MAQIYSTQEAKERFDEVIRKVRGGERVVITARGREVAEIRPIVPENETLEEKLGRLERAGVLTDAVGPKRPWKPVASRPGALERFLAERD